MWSMLLQPTPFFLSPLHQNKKHFPVLCLPLNSLPETFLPSLHTKLWSTAVQHNCAIPPHGKLSQPAVQILEVLRANEEDQGLRFFLWTITVVDYRGFSLKEIQKATNNFAEASIVGGVGFVKVYKGRIDDCDTIVAIKRRIARYVQGLEEFAAEIEVLSRLRHPHLVSLIGYCNDKREMILVYDYMSNRTLRDHLYETDNDPLPWKQRLEICIGAAKGLHYLHTGGKRTIIHRDVKSSKILLDDKWVAKISGFGLSLMSPSGMPNTNVSDENTKGTLGFLDPENITHLKLTEKSDVYSFGVVLFEVLCGRPVISHGLPIEQAHLTKWAEQCIGNGTVDQIIDPYLVGKIAPVCLKEFVTIAKSCVRLTGIERPMMGDVVEGLEFALQLQESADAANEENDSGDDEHTEYIYRGMSFTERHATIDVFSVSIITSARTDAVSSQT